MTYYHLKREDAQALAEEVAATDKRIMYSKVELVENNGWVVVLVPAYYDLREYGHQYEVRDKDGRRITPRPPEHRGVTPYGKAAAERQGRIPAAPRAAPAKVEKVSAFVYKPVEGGLQLPWMKGS